MSPILVLLDWLLFGPHGLVRWSDTLLWLLYPTAYAIIMITRGMLLPAVNDRFPYPFLDPTVAGFDGMIAALGRVILILALIALAVVALDRLALAVVALDRLASAVTRRRSRIPVSERQH
ncbi:Pr6Pr family membrane protein [Agromyces mangrovi Wang et al. 2018]|uniref:Pr6Pr family membrane protein n=1 Tax=Agromyces mangrovi TaxID=1858653 RepID=UPI0025725010|nr:Pr6Pr family membrane protein [Agromyces mangrovi]BDZ64616.1 hypothetical protein GCM10025877_15540 [Agromyces mangrovi]